MLDKDPKKRIALQDALKHKIFDGENERLLKNIKVSKKDLKKNFDL